MLWEIISRQEPFPHYDIYQAAHAVSERGERLPIPPNCPSKFAQIMHGYETFGLLTKVAGKRIPKIDLTSNKSLVS